MSEPNSTSSTIRNPGRDLIRQFVIYAENKLGWLNDFIVMFKSDDIHILAISVLDTSDSSVIRVIPNYPKDWLGYQSLNPYLLRNGSDCRRSQK